MNRRKNSIFQLVLCWNSIDTFTNKNFNILQNSLPIKATITNEEIELYTKIIIKSCSFPFPKILHYILCTKKLTKKN